MSCASCRSLPVLACHSFSTDCTRPPRLHSFVTPLHGVQLKIRASPGAQALRAAAKMVAAAVGGGKSYRRTAAGLILGWGRLQMLRAARERGTVSSRQLRNWDGTKEGNDERVGTKQPRGAEEGLLELLKLPGEESRRAMGRLVGGWVLIVVVTHEMREM